MSFIHPKSDVDPKAKLGKNVYIAAFAAIRADEGEVVVGDCSSVQESCVVHGKNVKIGHHVTVGHGAIVHGCDVGDYCIIGMNATLLSGCKIGEGSLIAAGAVVLEGQVIPPQSVVVGVPAKVLRVCSEEDARRIEAAAQNYIEKLKAMGKYDE